MDETLYFKILPPLNSIAWTWWSGSRQEKQDDYGSDVGEILTRELGEILWPFCRAIKTELEETRQIVIINFDTSFPIYTVMSRKQSGLNEAWLKKHNHGCHDFRAGFAVGRGLWQLGEGGKCGKPVGWRWACRVGREIIMWVMISYWMGEGLLWRRGIMKRKKGINSKKWTKKQQI